MILNGVSAKFLGKKKLLMAVGEKYRTLICCVKVESPSGGEVESRSDKQCGLSAPCFLFLGKNRYTCND